MKKISIAIGIIALCFGLQAHSDSGFATKPENTGKTMQEILSMLGEPQQKFPQVGEPPIIRWHYTDKTVYFEQDRVIHTVRHHSKNSKSLLK